MVPSQHRAAPIEDARAGGGWWDWVVVLSRGRARHPGGRWGDRIGVFASPSVFISPEKDTNSPLPRAAAVACGARRAALRGARARDV